MTEPKFDVVLFGATGFTGRLVAGYLSANAKVRWAIAGRNRDKLEAVKQELVRSHPAAAELGLLVGDSGDEASLRAIVKQTRVVCTTVGPYAKYGVLLARVCAQEGVHYTDLTGEVQFMRASIDENHAVAVKSGAKIVHACGFDSIPSDLGTYLLHRRARQDKLTLGRTTLMVRRISGGFSGGTIASIKDMIDSARRDSSVRKLMLNAHALEPDANFGRRPEERDQIGASFDAKLQAWTAPFVMAMCNTRVVRRSSALFDGVYGATYGAEFRYQEVMSFRPGVRGAAMAAAVSAGTAAFAATMSFPPSRSLLSLALPKPGEGPSEEARKSGSFSIQIVAETKRENGEAGPSLKVGIEGEGDPGYDATARIIGEASLCLAQDLLPPRAGVITPAFAMGDALETRLNNARVRFTLLPDA